jgi:hypothetical protein
MTKIVTIHSATVGQNFGSVGIVRDAKTKKKLAEADDVRPYGFDSAALGDAEALAKKNGWTVQA